LKVDRLPPVGRYAALPARLRCGGYGQMGTSSPPSAAASHTASRGTGTEVTTSRRTR
ncbi:hypothetical protein BAE44_0013093, partial [Dichanthelium oligosanthes]